MKYSSVLTVAAVSIALASVMTVCFADEELLDSASVGTEEKKDDDNDDFTAPHPDLVDSSKTYNAPSAKSAAFVDTFQSGLSKWTPSANEKYAGKLENVVSSVSPIGNIHDKGARVPAAAQHYGYTATLDKPIGNKEGQFVFQYELKAENSISCAGAYMKLLRAEAGIAADALDGDSPYTIMFGPDKCGATNKVHFIIQVKNPKSGEYEEKHFATPPYVKTDKLSHLYTLVIDSASNDFEIRIDGKTAKTGNLLSETDMKPPVNPPKEIDDPNDVKPEDWVDDAKIDDPEAVKPEDWDEDAPFEIPDESDVKPEGWLDDEPANIADPDAAKPEDWDDEEDGVWVAATIPNPKCEDAPGCGEWTARKIRNPNYKGKWIAPKIDNPDYKGEWAPAKIPNPDYYEVANPGDFAPIGAVAIEIWTMNDGLLFDNVYLGNSIEDAEAFANATFVPKSENEAALAENQRKKEAAARAAANDSLMNQALKYFDSAMDFVQDQPLIAAGAAMAGIIPVFALCYMGGSSGSSNNVSAADAAKKKDDDADADSGDDDDDDDDEEGEDETPAKGKGNLRKRKGAKKAD